MAVLSLGACIPDEQVQPSPTDAPGSTTSTSSSAEPASTVPVGAEPASTQSTGPVSTEPVSTEPVGSAPSGTGSGTSTGTGITVPAMTSMTSTTSTAAGTPSGGGGGPGELPGEPFGLAPEEGAVLAVVGVAADDVLNVRAGPGVEFAVVAGLAPTAAEAVATGRARQLDLGAVWVEVRAGDVTGWASFRYLAYLGTVDDVTSRLPQLPTGGDLVALAEQVARQRHPGPEGAPTVTVVDGPHVGDLGEVTVDVLGLLDDSVLGERLHVFAHPHDGVFTVRTVEVTTLCARGLSDGLCL